MDDANRQNVDCFVQLLINSQQRLTWYVRTLVPNRADADEVLQEVNLFIWQHADDFELGTNFMAWACRIAHYQVLTFRKRQSRSRLRFGDALVGQLSRTAARSATASSDGTESFYSCMDKLSKPDRELIELRYEPEATVESVAQLVGRSTKAVYNALARIRTWLLDCIEGTNADTKQGEDRKDRNDTKGAKHQLDASPPFSSERREQP